jgi:hypothetical protein
MLLWLTVLVSVFLGGLACIIISDAAWYCVTDHAGILTRALLLVACGVLRSHTRRRYGRRNYNSSRHG